MFKKNILYLVWIIGISSAFADDSYVSHAKKLSVYSLDQSLPKNVTLSEYLPATLPKGTVLEWSETVTDCGENDGTGNQEDYPLCAEILFHTPNGGEGYLHIALGTTKAGLNGAAEIFDGGYNSPSGKSQDIRKLSDLAVLIADLKMPYDK